MVGRTSHWFTSIWAVFTWALTKTSRLPKNWKNILVLIRRLLTPTESRAQSKSFAPNNNHMNVKNPGLGHQLLVVVTGLFLAVISARGQSAPIKPQQPQDDDVIRVNTELVQTDVMVFDKKGRFVSGLNPEQFVLKVDNKPRSIGFFERVASGSARETTRAEADRT